MLGVQLLLPSTYVKWLLPKSLYRFVCISSYLFWFIVGVFVLRKTMQATKAVRYIKTHAFMVSLDVIEQSYEFQELVRKLDRDFDKPPAILLLNQHALNMTFNFLCNTKMFANAHKRFVFVTLDPVAKEVLAKYWPNIQQFYLPTPSLYEPFSFAEGPYQTIYLLRANLAVALIKRGKSFWMMQQDTFWRKDLFNLELENGDGNMFDLLFDQIGHGGSSKRAEWVNGANFFVRANNHTQRFFEAIAAKIEHWYAPDMGICHKWDTPRCKYIPHTIAHSWEWMYTDQINPPYVMQLDCETDGGNKLQQLAKFGFYFTKPDGRTCNDEAVKKVQNVMERGKIGVGTPVHLSWGRAQFRLYWWLVDYLLSMPFFGDFIKPYLPLVGYILMFTL